MSFSQYVTFNSEALREKIVNHLDKKVLEVYALDIDIKDHNIESKHFRWDLYIEGFSKLIAKNTK